MKEFFEVITLEQALAHRDSFAPVGTESIALGEAEGRVLAVDLISSIDLPGFQRSTMDGYAVRASSTFGASESAPAFLEVLGSIAMGVPANFDVGPGQAVEIFTGGMLPAGADAVVMVEHTEAVDATAIEVTRAVAPSDNVIAPDEDVAAGQKLLAAGTRLWAAEIGLLAALGHGRVTVYRRPVVAILSTGDEVISVESEPGAGQVRDVNASTLTAMVQAAGGVARTLGIIQDDHDQLVHACWQATDGADMVLLSGGSSVGARDLTIDVLGALPRSEVLAHGIAIKPGKPTIIARVSDRPFFGLPGHVASAMVVFQVLVRPFVHRIAGRTPNTGDVAARVRARLSRNVASVHGRREYVRVRLEERDDGLWAVPRIGKSGLIRTAVESDGLIEIGDNCEGLEQGAAVVVNTW